MQQWFDLDQRVDRRQWFDLDQMRKTESEGKVIGGDVDQAACGVMLIGDSGVMLIGGERLVAIGNHGS